MNTHCPIHFKISMFVFFLCGAPLSMAGGCECGRLRLEAISIKVLDSWGLSRPRTPRPSPRSIHGHSTGRVERRSRAPDVGPRHGRAHEQRHKSTRSAEQSERSHPETGVWGTWRRNEQVSRTRFCASSTDHSSTPDHQDPDVFTQHPYGTCTN